MGSSIDKKLIIRELNGQTTIQESMEIDQWINESPENQKIYQEIWSAFQLATPDVDPFITDKEAAWSRIERKIQKTIERKSLWVQLSSIAAAAIIFFTIGTAVQFFQSNEIPATFLDQYSKIVVPKGQKSMIVLPDGSSVWLNSGSELKYKNNFNTRIREVELIGEAFFEVKKDPSKMFRVLSGAIAVEVHGTAFNIKNYGEEKKIEVTVENGKVGILEDGNKLTELTRGKQVLINKEKNEFQLNSANVEVVTAWKNNELVFDGTPFEEVIRYLERWYGVNITIEEKMKKKHNYTFKVKTESFRELMELLKEITPLQYKVDGKNVTIRYAN
jgi:transmembrane sensor